MQPRNRYTRHVLFGVLACVALGAAAQTGDRPRSTDHNGRWNVVVACEDVRDASGVVKGYSLPVPVAIRDGVLSGRYESKSTASVLVLTGSVFVGGVLEIAAKGVTGAPEYTVGKLAEGRPYAYAMTGQLQAASGEAVRTAVRPCKATFTKQ